MSKTVHPLSERMGMRAEPNGHSQCLFVEVSSASVEEAPYARRHRRPDPLSGCQQLRGPVETPLPPQSIIFRAFLMLSSCLLSSSESSRLSSFLLSPPSFRLAWTVESPYLEPLLFILVNKYPPLLVSEMIRTYRST